MTPKPSDVESLRAFFHEHPELTTYELAKVAGRSASTIRNWKRKCGIESDQTGWGSKRDSIPFINKPKKEKREVERVTDPNIWDNEAWFKQQYEKNSYGIPTISRIIGRSIALVKGRLEKYQVRVRSHAESVKSKNPCFDKDWLDEHYNRKRWSLTRCAQEAGVVPYTIYNWLVSFDFEIRDIYEAMSGDNNPFHGRTHSKETKEKIRQRILELRKSSGNGSANKEAGKRS